MPNYFNVAEKFISINGEGTKAGQLSVFIRFKGCNLNCSYCDTKWANKINAPSTTMTAEEIVTYIQETKIKNVTITGGEPLIQNHIISLLTLISKQKELSCEIETNGSINLKPFSDIPNRPSFTMDYKLPSSNMEKYMCIDNFKIIRQKDTVKFVAGNINDLKRAKEIIDEFELYGKTNLYISPVFGSIEPKEIVGFMTENKMNNVNLQLQMHKIIWDADMKGV